MANSGNCVEVKFVYGDRKFKKMLPVPLNFQQILNHVVNLFNFQRFCLHFRNINILVPLNDETDLEYIWHLFQLRKDRKQRFDLLVTPLREDGSLGFRDESGDEFSDGKYYNSSVSEIQSCDFYPDYEDEADNVPKELRRHQSGLTRALSSPQSSVGSSSAASSGSVSSNNIASTAAANSSPPNQNTSHTGGLFIPEIDDDDVYFCETPRSGYAASISGGSYNSLISSSSSVQNISSHNNPDTIHSPPLASQYEVPKRHLDESMPGSTPKWPLSGRNGTDGRGSNDTRNRSEAQFFFTSAVMSAPFSGSHSDFLPDAHAPESALVYSANSDDHSKAACDRDSARYSGSSLGIDDEISHDFNSRANAVGLTVVTNDLNQKTPLTSSSRDTLTGGNSSCPHRSHGTYPRAKNDICETAGLSTDEILGVIPNSKNSTAYNRSGVWNTNTSVYSRKMHGASSDINLSGKQNQVRANARATSTPIYEATQEHGNLSSMNFPANSNPNGAGGAVSKYSRAPRGAVGERKTNNRPRKEEAADTSGISSGTTSDFSDDVPSRTSSHAVNNGIWEVDTVEDMKQWVKGKVLGAGAFGTVRQYYNQENGVERAVKEVQMTERTPERTLTAAQNEIHCLTQLSHERIVKFCGTGVDDYKILIFMELMPGGSVKSQLDEYGPLTESVCRKYLMQILDGLIYLHNSMVIHRDLKCANILRDGNGNVKLSDFGCAKMLADMIRHSGSVNSFSCTGSPYWMSPEVILNERYTRKADIWSLGCTVVEMVTGKPPNSHREPLPAMYNLVAEKSCNPEFPKGASEGLKDFVTQALTFSQHSRPSATDLRHHQFLKVLQKSHSSTK